MIILAKRRKKVEYVSHSNPNKTRNRWSFKNLFSRLWERYKNRKFGHFYDYKLVATVLILCCFGLVMVYSSSAYTARISPKYTEFHFLKQEAIFMCIGLVAMVVISFFDYHWIKGWMVFLFYILCAGLMVLTDFTSFGIEVNGQKRWINIIPGVRKLPSYQPSELVKIAIILTMACMIPCFYRNMETLRGLFLHVAVVGVLAGLVLIRNLSAGIIVFTIGAGMYFVAGRWRWLYLACVIGLVAGLVVIYNNPEILTQIPLLNLKSYQLTRIKVWADPTYDPLKDGYQVLQGLYAIGSGGLFGKGLGNSMQKLGFIPESYNDMIFSIICEELGVFGAICILSLFAYLIYRMMFIFTKAPDLKGGLIVFGVVMQIGMQTLLNVAVVTNSLPNTGVALPFISYGGTSVAILLAEMGLVLNVGRQITYRRELENVEVKKLPD